MESCFWSNEMVLEFLELYEAQRLIWDPSQPLHKNRNDIHDAWRAIQQQLKFKGSISDLKKKKDSLMASFRACHNKVLKSIKSGTGTEDVYKPNWFAYDRMASFLRNTNSPRQTINTEVRVFFYLETYTFL